MNSKSQRANDLFGGRACRRHRFAYSGKKVNAEDNDKAIATLLEEWKKDA